MPYKREERKKSIPPNNIGITSSLGIRKKPKKTQFAISKNWQQGIRLGKNPKTRNLANLLSRSQYEEEKEVVAPSSHRNLIERGRRSPPKQSRKKRGKNRTLLVRAGIGSECARERKLILLAPLRSNELETYREAPLGGYIVHCTSTSSFLTFLLSFLRWPNRKDTTIEFPSSPIYRGRGIEIANVLWLISFFVGKCLVLLCWSIGNLCVYQRLLLIRIAHGIYERALEKWRHCIWLVRLLYTVNKDSRSPVQKGQQERFPFLHTNMPKAFLRVKKPIFLANLTRTKPITGGPCWL